MGAMSGHEATDERGEGMRSMAIYVDADACPVKEEVYRVAARHGLAVFVVSNSAILVPNRPGIERVVVAGGLDVADDWIAERIGPDDLAITSDIPLAERCLRRGASVLGPKGQPFTEDSIGEALATRALLDTLRQSGLVTGGPKPFLDKDRSRFLSKLDEMIWKIRRRRVRDQG
jgi:uncharacterized protein